ncbi:MAG: hypothetical protein ACREP6_07575 [Candidatus Binataceae bacterium]
MERIVFFAVLSAVVALSAAGCADSALARARRNIAAHQYAEGHQQALAALENRERLSAAGRREAEDDVCETEFSIGAPTYPLSEQQKRCAQAAAESGSHSGPILYQLDAERLAIRAHEADDALSRGDISTALTAAEEYSAIEGADPQRLSRWRRTIWRTIDRHDTEALGAHRRQARRAIAQLGYDYRGITRMNRTHFERWIKHQVALGETPMVSGVSVRRGVAEIAVQREMLPALSINLARLVKINDALIARCRCAGRTSVVLPETGFPIYVATLNPDLRQSQVLILPQP